MILCSGCFDGLHAGHVAYLEGAKKLAPGETLFCAVAPDSYIRKAKKREPYWSQADRVRTLQAVRPVDVVFSQVENKVSTLIKRLMPTAFVKGDGWRGDVEVESVCHALHIPIWITPGTERKHTSEAMP